MVVKVVAMAVVILVPLAAGRSTPIATKILMA